MKKLLVLTIVFHCSAPLGATTLTFNVDPAQTGIVFTQSDFPSGNHNINFHSSDLNGTILNGQSLSLDAVLGNDVLARVFALFPNQFGILLDIQTTAHGNPGFAGVTTGFIRDGSGTQLSSTMIAGRAMGDDGTTSMGLVSFTRADFGGAQVFDMSGVHFDTSLPTTGQTDRTAPRSLNRICGLWRLS
jgi:hypothetical protein